MAISSLVSVIVPNYNHASFLVERINSILNQTYQDFELILLDDASTDHSLSVLNTYKNHPKVSYLVVNKSNSGSPFKQWLKGFDLAKGSYIWIAESDDFSSPNFLKETMALFSNQEINADVVFVGTQNVDEHGAVVISKSRIERKYQQLLAAKFSIKGHDFLPMFLPNYCVIRNASAAVFKISMLTPKARKISRYKTIGDYYFWVNVCLENRTIYYLPDRLNFMRSHANNVRKSKIKQQFKRKEFKEVHKEILRKRFYDFRVSRILLKHYAKKWLKLT